jgi:hypothetical protein
MKISSQLENNFDYCSAKGAKEENRIRNVSRKGAKAQSERRTGFGELTAPFDGAQGDRGAKEEYSDRIVSCKKRKGRKIGDRICRGNPPVVALPIYSNAMGAVKTILVGRNHGDSRCQ